MPRQKTPVEPEMIEAKGGFFIMGSDEGADDEKPAHEVWVDPFGISKFTITNHDYDVFLKSSQYPVVPPFFKDPNFSHPMQPVTGVSWHDSTAYSDWLNKLSGRNYRLPTEAEWEFAATSGLREHIYPWGTAGWQQRPELHEKFQLGPEPVGSFPPSPLGIHDMGMNVHEWCSDWYDKAYYTYSPAWNPKGAQDGARKASRGGSWRHQIKITRCSARSSLPPGMRYADYGFRLACDLQP